MGELNPVLEEYLNLKSKSTAKAYRASFRKFNQWYEGDVEDLLNKTYDDMKQPLREQRRIAETTINRWVKWLKGEGYSNNTIIVYFAALQNFFKYHHVTLSASWISAIPAPTPKKENRKHEWTLDQMREFVGLATNFRDKALIVCMFQSGLGIREIINLDYGDIRDQLESNVLPVCLDLVRQKTKQPFKSFFGRDAIKFLKLYIETRSNLEDDSPLFAMLGRSTRISKEAIEKRFKELAQETSFVKEKRLNNGYNPLRPHSLRSAFRSRLTGKMDGDLIEFFMGHSLPKQKGAYINLPTVELRELYANHEHLLAIEKTSKDELIEGRGKGVRVPQETLKDLETLKETVAILSNENREIKRHYNELENKNDLLEKRIEGMADQWEQAMKVLDVIKQREKIGDS